jgi:hypothetical protein
MATDDNQLSKKENSHTYAERRKHEKQEALREFIRGHNYLQKIHNDVEDPELTTDTLPVVKFRVETRLKLLGKILPDLKAVELSGDAENPVQTVITWKQT